MKKQIHQSITPESTFLPMNSFGRFLKQKLGFGNDLETQPGSPQKKQKSLSETDVEFLKKVKSTVNQELTNPELTASYLAKRSFVSHSQLFRKLKSLTGEPPSSFIINSRLDKGYELLKRGAGNVAEIAMLCGFKNSKHFSTRFKKRFGVTPRQVRVG